MDIYHVPLHCSSLARMETTSAVGANNIVFFILEVLPIVTRSSFVSTNGPTEQLNGYDLMALAFNLCTPRELSE